MSLSEGKYVYRHWPVQKLDVIIVKGHSSL